jgi:multiple sugar transport system permease protein
MEGGRPRTDAAKAATSIRGRPNAGASRAATRRSALVGYVFVLPYVCFLVFFGIGPTIYAFFLSFHSPGGGLLSFGLSGYRAAIADPYFKLAVRNVVEFVLLLTPVFSIIVPVLALLLHSRRGGLASGIRLLYFLPGAVSGSVVVLVWLFMLDPSASPYHRILRAFGWHTVEDVVNRQNYLFLFALMFLWSALGGWIVITYGALKNISDEIVGAARIDGCGPIALARYISIPMIRKTLFLMVILVIAAASQVYTEPTVVGGIMGDSGSWGLSQVSYNLAFGLGYFEASAAVAMMLVAFALVAAALIVARSDFLRSAEQ